MPSRQSLYSEAWDEMWDMDNARNYYAAVAHSSQLRLKAFTIAVALLSSSAIAGWGMWAQMPVLWAWLVGANSILVVLQPRLRFGDNARNATALQRAFNDLFHEWKLVFLQIRIGQPLEDLMRKRDRCHAKRRNIEAREHEGLNVRLAKKVEQRLRPLYESWAEDGDS